MKSPFAATAALAACAAMIAAPLAAAELPVQRVSFAVATPGVFDADAVNAHSHRYYRRNRTDVGDVIGTVVAIGAIAAVASAVSKASSRSRDYRNQDRYRYPDSRADYRRGGYDSRYPDGSRGLDRAVDMCAAEVERNARIDAVDGASRSGTGWAVTGRLRTGEPFTCAIGADGRIDAIDYGQRGGTADNQWGDDRYAAARAAHDAGSDGRADEYDDGRYDSAQAPDVSG